MNTAGGAIVGALLGGVLGHQVGGGTGRDIATVGGALAGAAIGSNMGGDGRGNYGQDVRRCEEVASTMPAYWDVTYQHRGINHRVQLATEPGEFIQVNEDGLPRM
ncbi:Glycine zipper 2TM domain-containing protein [Duganella sp. CF458]|uniref:glycine zipper 2TM domain-containing protein n=1 Tax=Duganella sp. CF458 TaxID=1884368 RepID=UPI0008E99439|nr:glycine zipper 2TM domain-containing protein [Duganella sp. CF458]SFG07159.1 Glycine zipper 2TM domain-containing protein [Duganella sp. CF458]